MKVSTRNWINATPPYFKAHKETLVIPTANNKFPNTVTVIIGLQPPGESRVGFSLTERKQRDVCSEQDEAPLEQLMK